MLTQRIMRLPDHFIVGKLDNAPDMLEAYILYCYYLIHLAVDLLAIIWQIHIKN